MTTGAVSKTLFYHGDHLGGTNVLTDSSGVKKELIEYEPFGLFSRHEKYGSSAEVANFYFTGKPLDDETGLYYYGARYYDPRVGRFTSADTVVQSPTNPQTLNRYSYTSNNPVNRIDPDGHKWDWGKFWKAAAGAFVGVVAGILLGPAGFALVGTTMAGIIGGAAGGALTGGLEGGWKGAMFGALAGGALGGLGSWAGGLHNATGNMILGGMFAAGVGITAATDSWDSFAGGLAGGIAGASVGKGIVGSQGFKNFKNNKNNNDIRIALNLKEHSSYQRSLDRNSRILGQYDIDLTYAKGGRAFYNPYMPDGTAGLTTPDGIVTIGSGAFQSEAELLGTIGHESVHAFDFSWDLFATRSMLEINATSWELANQTNLYYSYFDIFSAQIYQDTFINPFLPNQAYLNQVLIR